jgi:hypothetical protein
VVIGGNRVVKGERYVAMGIGRRAIFVPGVDSVPGVDGVARLCQSLQLILLLENNECVAASLSSSVYFFWSGVIIVVAKHRKHMFRRDRDKSRSSFLGTLVF